MPYRPRPIPEPTGTELSALVKLDIALAARETRPSSTQSTPHPLPRLVQELGQLAAQPSSEPLMQAIDQMDAGHIPAETICDVYLPEVAKHLGGQWFEDSLAFTDVTVALSRLQSSLRRFEPMWRDQIDPMSARPSCLVGVAAGAQHTLGASLIANQLRRRGLTVQLDLHLTPKSMRKIAQTMQHSAVFLSTTGCEDLETLANLVQNARTSVATTPIVVGGSALHSPGDLRTATRADLATTDLDEALKFCDLPEDLLQQPHGIQPQTHGSEARGAQ